MYAVHRICHHPDPAPRLIGNYGRYDRPILSKIAHRLLITRQEVVSILLSQAQKGNDGSQVECGIAQTTVDPIDQHRITRRCEDDVSRVQVEVARVPRCVLQFLVESPHILGGAGHPRWPGPTPMVPAARVKLTSWWCFACHRGQETKYVCLAIVPKSIQTRRTLPAVNGFELLAASRFGAKKCSIWAARRPA
jgi:hypothetical protein